ncbi:hypothetical protein PIROE2DRAFT_16212 [Piromyces sp. E2]|nr:hypothetical protein PIROE2DRAFT_16212 [Piromyces sp. E2]|eukprot:OUM58490.1 hypothetical protein PIROE2DRAFT_16212 [Piromyces sp. E2]
MNNDFESENSKINDNKLNNLNKKRSNEIFESISTENNTIHFDFPENNTNKRRKIISYNIHEVDLNKNSKDKIETDSIFDITKSILPNNKQNISNTSINDDLKNDEMDVYQVKFLNRKSIKKLLIAKLIDIKYQYYFNRTFLFKIEPQTPTSRFDDICYLYDINELKQLRLAQELNGSNNGINSGGIIMSISISSDSNSSNCITNNNYSINDGSDGETDDSLDDYLAKHQQTTASVKIKSLTRVKENEAFVIKSNMK